MSFLKSFFCLSHVVFSYKQTWLSWDVSHMSAEVKGCWSHQKGWKSPTCEWAWRGAGRLRSPAGPEEECAAAPVWRPPPDPGGCPRPSAPAAAALRWWSPSEHLHRPAGPPRGTGKVAAGVNNNHSFWHDLKHGKLALVLLFEPLVCCYCVCAL